MKKKTILIICFCLMLVFSLTACDTSSRTVQEVTTTTEAETTTEPVNPLEKIWDDYWAEVEKTCKDFGELTNADYATLEEYIQNNWVKIRDSENIFEDNQAITEFSIAIGCYYYKFDPGTNGHSLGEIGINYLKSRCCLKTSEAATYEEQFVSLYKDVLNIDLNNAVDVSSATLGEQNALKSAKSYMNYSSFSRQGLIEQLEYEGYTHEEAVFGADNGQFDWKEAAAQSAQSYMKYSGFSYQGLLDQLLYEGYTQEEAIYGVESGNFDWNDAAARSAESYMKYSSFSRQGLIDQLLYEGFTYEQAEYGVQKVGY